MHKIEQGWFPIIHIRFPSQEDSIVLFNQFYTFFENIQFNINRKIMENEFV